MDNIILYTTHCPKCSVLEKKLKQKNVNYTECTDTAVMQEKGILFAPVLEVNGKMFPFAEAVLYVNTLE